MAESLLAIEGKSVTIYDDVELLSGFTLIQSNSTVEMKKGAKVRSARSGSCNTVKRNADMFTCIPRNPPTADKIEYDDVIDRFMTQFPTFQPEMPTNHLRFEQLWNALQLNYTSYIIALSDLKMSEASVEGSRVGICAANVEMWQSKIDVSA